MAFKIAISLSLAVIMMLSSGKPVDFPNDLERWYVTIPPEEGSDQLLAARVDVEHEWVVTPGKKAPQVGIRGRQQESSPSLPFTIKPGPSKEGLTGRRTAAKIDDGWIVGFDAGEFGAGLWWFSPDGKERYKISDDHILNFIATTSGLIAIEGLEHGTISKGKAIRLSRNEQGHWFAEPLIEFGEAPQVVLKDGDHTILVVTSKRLLRVNFSSKKVDILLDKAFWSGLYPNSIVITPSGTIFIGMRHGIAKIEKKNDGYSPSWLLPTKQFANESFIEGFK
jgi:hypothetical protein